MTSPDPHPGAHIEDLIRRRREGYSLEREFYTSEEVHRLDMERIWRRSWVFAGHTCEAREPGDYLTLEVDGDPIIVIRGDDRALRAFHNVCRHRGTVILEEASGHAGKLICPYHQWVYGRDGKLLGCRGMQEDIDRSQLGLKPVRLFEVEGLVFIALSDDAPAPDEAREHLTPYLRPQGFERARVAKAIDYEIPANWKLVWENNRECYHCIGNHPQYVKANFDHYNADDTAGRTAAAISAATRKSEEKWAEHGLAVTHKQTGMTVFPDRHWFSANRTPLVEGFVSESLDGRRVAPLMGDYTEPDVGTLRIRALPNFWNHSSCDHGVTTRLLPAGPRRTLARVTWLVRADAVEGRDYRLEDLLPFWQLTSEQDWKICAQAQKGVSSSAYSPGPYSTYKEYNVEGFVRWYLKRLQEE
ncbi:MAG TPA: aromatic ring-hydroxylating dioxygenase subunit alpha [Planctomycetota bacterium]|nr:aromatic ring-hydroxylating dioxygenase subunit alpha [Planctomycetota bacterium]